MKNATGEANITVITIVLIGVVAALGLALIPRLNKTTQPRACCTDAGGKWTNSECKPVSGIDFNQTAYNSCTAK